MSPCYVRKFRLEPALQAQLERLVWTHGARRTADFLGIHFRTIQELLPLGGGVGARCLERVKGALAALEEQRV